MLESIDHVNLVVDDLDRMAGFYGGVLGLTETKRVTISGKWIAAVVGLADVEADVIYLEPAGGGPRVELLKYRRPPVAAPRPAGLGEANTPGLRHLAFRVRDIEPYVERLRRAGVAFLSQVQVVPTAQVTYAGDARKHIAYFRDPEGNLLELCEYKAGD